MESIAEALRPLSLWRKVSAVFGATLLFGGMIGFKIAFSPSEIAWSIAVVILGFGAIAIAYAAIDTKPGTESNG